MTKELEVETKVKQYLNATTVIDSIIHDEDNHLTHIQIVDCEKVKQYPFSGACYDFNAKIVGKHNNTNEYDVRGFFTEDDNEANVIYFVKDANRSLISRFHDCFKKIGRNDNATLFFHQIFYIDDSNKLVVSEFIPRDKQGDFENTKATYAMCDKKLNSEEEIVQLYNITKLNQRVDDYSCAIIKDKVFRKALRGFVSNWGGLNCYYRNTPLL